MRNREETAARRIRRPGWYDLTRRRRAWPSYATIAILVGACASPARNADECRQRPRSILIRIADDIAGSVVIDSVRRVQAPTLRFSATLRSDPSHIHALQAPIRGILVRVAPERHVDAGDTVALIRPDRDTAAPNVAIVVTHEGKWVPRRRAKQLVLRDTVGLLEEHDYLLAVGMVTDVEAAVIHEGDPGLIELGDVLQLRQRGNVAWVRGPDERMPFSAEVAFGIQSPLLSTGQQVTVAVTPVGPQDSLLAVPPSALVQMAHGTAVFVAVGPNLYEARWVTSSQLGTEVSFVRGAIAAGSRVGVDGLTPLVDTVRDSLQKGGRACQE